MLREKSIRLAVVDFWTFATGLWDHDLMALSGSPDPHWHGSFPASLAAENASKCENAMLAGSPGGGGAPVVLPHSSLSRASHSKLAACSHPVLFHYSIGTLPQHVAVNPAPLHTQDFTLG